jgi:hypothetical protein
MTNYPFGKILPKEIDLPVTREVFLLLYLIVYSLVERSLVIPAMSILSNSSFASKHLLLSACLYRATVVLNIVVMMCSGNLETGLPRGYLYIVETIQYH